MELNNKLINNGVLNGFVNKCKDNSRKVMSWVSSQSMSYLPTNLLDNIHQSFCSKHSPKNMIVCTMFRMFTQ